MGVGLEEETLPTHGGMMQRPNFPGRVAEKLLPQVFYKIIRTRRAEDGDACTRETLSGFHPCADAIDH
jgi:hypothetical protein